MTHRAWNFVPNCLGMSNYVSSRNSSGLCEPPWRLAHHTSKAFVLAGGSPRLFLVRPRLSARKTLLRHVAAVCVRCLRDLWLVALVARLEGRRQCARGTPFDERPHVGHRRWRGRQVLAGLLDSALYGCGATLQRRDANQFQFGGAILANAQTHWQLVALACSEHAGDCCLLGKSPWTHECLVDSRREAATVWVRR